MGRSPGGTRAGDEPAGTGVASWSIDHISGVTLAVREMAESVAFYDKLGFEVSYGGPDAPFTTMRAGQSVVNLRQAATSGGAGSRVILRVRGVDALHRDLVGKGLGPTAPRDAEWGERYFEIPDPQGVVISCAEPFNREHISSGQIETDSAR
jgi:catechol 2,3-dioxygenase-like lactoylglutathione lyase family enzyme